MEIANDTAMHVTETKNLCSSPSSPVTKSEEITKDQEEELLGGNSEDGDEEDALSDDSMRLRLSDDETEPDEPNSEHSANKRGSEQGRNMELGSDVPAIDTPEQNNTMKMKNFSNQINNFFNKVKQEDLGSNDSFAEDVVPKTDGFFYMSEDSKFCNGDITQTETKSISDDPKIDTPKSQWKFSGYFGKYLGKNNKNSQSVKPQTSSSKYATDSYKNKYYNINNYYGGGKGSGSGVFSSHRNRDRISEEKSSATDRSTYTPKRGSDDEKRTDAFSAKIKTEAPAKEPSGPNKEAPNNAQSQSSVPNETPKSTNDDKETDGVPGKDDGNSEALPVGANNSIPLKTPQNVDPEGENRPADPKVDRHSSSEFFETEVEKSEVGDPSDTTVIDGSSPSVEGKGIENNDNVIAEKEPRPIDSKGPDGDAEEVRVCTDKIEEKVASKETEEITNGPNSDDNSELRSSGKDEVPVEEVQGDDGEPIVGNDEGSLEMAELELAAELRKSDEPEQIDIEQIEKDEPKELESEKTEIPVGDTEKSQIEPTVVPAPPEEKSSVTDSKRVSGESSSVGTTDKESVEKDVVAEGKKIASEPQPFDLEAHIADLPDEKETSSDDESEGKLVKVMHTSLKRSPTDSLDEMELCRRMRIRRKNNESDRSVGQPTAGVAADPKEPDVTDKTDVNARTAVDPSCNAGTDTPLDSKTNPTTDSTRQSKVVDSESNDGKENIEKNDDCEVIEVPVKKKQKRGRRSLQSVRENVNSQQDNEEKENVRQRRRTAKNAEEIIRKEFLGNSDSESIDGADNFVAVNYKKNGNNLRSASPPTLKRNYVEEGEKLETSTVKKLKQDSDGNDGDVSKKSEKKASEKIQTLAHVRRFFRRDNNGKLAKLKQEELEELLIQKIVETITMRDEIGKLREQAKISERNQEATRLRCQQLAKQIKDFEMVLNRYHNDRRANPEKNVVPIKINRSVGLQVNWVTDPGIHNLRQLEQMQKVATPIANGTSSSPQIEQTPPSVVPVAKRTIKVRSPRRSDQPIVAPAAVSTPVHNQHPAASNMTPSPMAVAKNVTDCRTPVTPTVHQTTVPHPIAPKQTIVVNGPIGNQPIRQATAIQLSKSNKSDLIDLTQEEDKTKSNVVSQKTIMTTAITETSPNISTMQKIAPRFHTVIQALPGSVAITAQPGIRVVQPSSQPTPTALVNNMNAPRLTYVMQGGMGSARPIVMTSTPTPIRPAPAIRTTFPLSGTITNGTVRVIPMSSAGTIQVYKHPAALPEPLNPPSNPSWKLPPPAPSLKISKVTNGIVLSWNMALSDQYADIASYQLFAYQEVSGIAPSTTLWKKVGDVRALPLPMACTLTQFSEGNNYYFAVRAVDKHTRFGFYSQPGNISL